MQLFPSLHSSFHAVVIVDTCSEGNLGLGPYLEGPYVAVTLGFEPATLWMQGTKLTTEPLCPTILIQKAYMLHYVMY